MLQKISKVKNKYYNRPTKNNKNFYESINPFTERVIETYPYESLDKLCEKLQIADAAFQDWKNFSVEERSEPVRKFAELLKEKKTEFSIFMSKEMGKPLSQAMQEIDLCIGICEHAVENGPEILKDKDVDFEEGRALITYQPEGVILSIQPWNFPFYQAIRYAVPNIIAGNTTLLSHAPSVWGSARRIEDTFREAGLPEGVFQLIYAQNEDMEILFEQREVRGVTFTGSPDTGRKVAENAAKNLKKTVLELGGNDAYIVTAGADLTNAVQECVKGRIINNGQTCTAAKRIIVVKSVYRKFKKMFVEAMKEVKMGDPLDKTTKLGPLVRKDLLEKLNDQVQETLDLGGHCLTGGHIANREGYFFEPTILEGLLPGMPAYDDEMFGPVASLIEAQDLEHALDIANSSKFGLGSGIFGNEEEVLEIARKKIDAGMVNINGFTNARPQLPFGGVKDSGYGREHGSNGFLEFVNVKTIKIHR